jgi:hypothetical protein
MTKRPYVPDVEPPYTEKAAAVMDAALGPHPTEADVCRLASAGDRANAIVGAMETPEDVITLCFSLGWRAADARDGSALFHMLKRALEAGYEERLVDLTHRHTGETPT